eukprot:UC1_evm2s1935
MSVGHLDPAVAPNLLLQLRVLKCNPEEKRVPPETELALVMPSDRGTYPGLYIFTSPSRLMRPVHNLRCDATELVGSFEQVYVEVAVTPQEIVPASTTHVETDPKNILSVVASMTPFSDFNQSPRNMYQCQMGKQTMGVPAHTVPFRADNKLYSLNTGQTPMVRPQAYDEFEGDNYPTGTNAVVCVISYTGYDMEDAMILNKQSMERGFGHARVFTTKVADLAEYKQPGQPLTHRFGTLPKDRSLKGPAALDTDGLPLPGTRINPGDPLYSVVDDSTRVSKVIRYKGEPATVERVCLLGSESRSDPPRASIQLMVNRNPIIGDKFASRHGQKGILSQLWPAADMPFTESGMVPDILFNPHGFPSRMTIGMFIESMAGKSAALHGVAHEAAPFKFDEQHTAVDYFGEQLARAGYNYQGTERMYSGITGVELDVDVFIGCVYYQRLRHMISDKFQVRTTGPVHNLTRQPIKGRKRHGGVRFGEMERDSLISHGAAFLLQDRLYHCSDESRADVCRTCGSMVAPLLERATAAGGVRRPICLLCGDQGDVTTIAVPYVYRYLTSELLSMGIKMSLDIAVAG